MADIIINKCRYRFPGSCEAMSWEQWHAVTNYAETPEADREEASANILSVVCRIGRRRAGRTEAADRDRFIRWLAHSAGCGRMDAEAGEKHEDGIRHTPSGTEDHIPRSGRTADKQGIGIVRSLARRLQGFVNPGKGKRARPGDTGRGDCGKEKPKIPMAKGNDGDGRRGNTRLDATKSGFRPLTGWLPFRNRLVSRERKFRPRKAEELIRIVSAVELCEATDLYLLDRREYAPLIAAILRHPGKTYRESRVRRRAEKMHRMRVGTMLGIFGELESLHRLLGEKYPYCYSNPLRAGESHKKSPTTWNDLLLWAARHTPGEVERVQRMPCGDFMALVQSRIRMNG